MRFSSLLISPFPYLIILAVALYACGGDSEVSQEEVSHHETFKRNPKEVIKQDDIALEIYDFQNFHPFLDQQDDHIHVVNFWATWCKPCVAELPYFEELGEVYPEVDITLVSLDFRKNVETHLLPFLKENDLQSEVIMLHEPDANSWVPKVDPNWSGAIPATVIYRNDNQEFYEQSFTFEELETEIKKFK